MTDNIVDLTSERVSRHAATHRPEREADDPRIQLDMDWFDDGVKFTVVKRFVDAEIEPGMVYVGTPPGNPGIFLVIAVDQTGKHDPIFGFTDLRLASLCADTAQGAMTYWNLRD